MTRLIILIIILSMNRIAKAQPSYDARRDYTWILGHEYFSFDTLELIHLNFNLDTLQLHRTRTYNYGQGLFQTNASICDTAGNLILYSNGCVIADNSHHLVEGAEVINDGVRWEGYCDLPYAGYVLVNGIWSLPVGAADFKFLYCDRVNHANTSGMRETRVKQDNILEYKAVNKDKYIINADLQPQYSSAVRHANGLDWWMVQVKYGKPTFYLMYLDSTNIVYPVDSFSFPQLTAFESTGGAQACFSPDGTLYASLAYDNGCILLDFDRCSGLLSNPRKFNLPIETFAITGIAISANSRFMYLMLDTEIWQYDLFAFDLNASGILVAQNDGWTYGSSNLGLSFYQSQLGPDGKIYIFPPAGRSAFSVIDQPDSLGVACNVIQHKYFFPDWGNVSQPPRFPNFRLGPVVGSPCDTLTVSTNAPEPIQARMALRPNPATSHAVADISVHDYSADMQLMLTVTDLSGSEVARYRVPPYAALQRIETSGLPNGMYAVTLNSKGRVLKTEKLVVLRE